ncbi:MAG: hypothetical protein KKI14_03850 [Nanoarchaeota archaeon]|nr:hypothetical protein [Nanoarchaeota archaeon]
MMVKCKNCKLLKNIAGKKGQCYGFKVPDVRVDIECKFFEDRLRKLE